MTPLPPKSIYEYWPSIPLAVVAAVLFAIMGGLHLILLVRKRCNYFVPVVVGAVMEVVGYIVRIPSGRKPDNVGLFAIQTLFILLPPLLFAASIYMTLGRLLRYLNKTSLSVVPVKYMTGFFVTGDIVSFLMQCAGGGIQASHDPITQKHGEDIAVAGLGIQLAFFSFFVVASYICHRRLAKEERASGAIPHNWRRVLLCLYLTSALILIRSIFRVVEFVTGYRGVVMAREFLLYIFDALMMFFCLVVMMGLHPAFVIGAGTTVAEDMLTEEDLARAQQDQAQQDQAEIQEKPRRRWFGRRSKSTSDSAEL